MAEDYAVNDEKQAKLLSHFSPDSMFSRWFFKGAAISNVVCSKVDDPAKVSPNSFVEYTELKSKNYQIPEKCILSGIITTNNDQKSVPTSSKLHFNYPFIAKLDENSPENIENSYVTIMFSQEDDLKRAHKFMELPLFEVKNSAEESLEATLKMSENGFMAEELSMKKYLYKKPWNGGCGRHAKAEKSSKYSCLSADGGVIGSIVDQTLMG
uniref:L-fucokinase domain-containing protein n=1 Tax=Ditylenchus dipsaci TaxID=166011 RepID=A0A915D0A6_9BILA